MTPRGKKTRTFPLPVVIFTTLAVSVAVTTYLHFHQIEPAAESSQETDSAEVSKPQEAPETPEPVEEPSTSDCSVTPEACATPEENPKASVQNEGADPNSSAVLTGALTRVAVADDKLVLRVNIDQYLSGGSCELTMRSGSKVYLETANISDVASTSTCEGFDIPVSNLPSGDWEILIKLNSGDKTGEISGRVSI